ncbi:MULTISPECIES: carboxylating nicotinate-nucleotide diphosphorylase [Prochlorococcus]|uniref:Probable nicotinate-nucleotide pyrophosphorylase [carboxylating] n=1 Tax=Prochlorococcus marinus (strain SARG / CCMP1375 / SS120) TaxID=167539 RepID=Q7VE02_PROMA|nr:MULTISPECIES: carboxylating nicotinate-nucleotide diphosphorylase [Prochlorococcus]AAP99259.1 Nicotinate-nucleotide pyrophosphorylase [Prochlorococcus marinus subsp. marinus str. CCMP1375]KGG11472.1 Quinolinate phosphoribosyltransferase (decarboxylating) [Prochlorococcus marinus str. LG]KGG18574.1 Quinolinate phosphoribosyltransferase (decarboxylating) [Prochlorococcus marinus str. SS2]KGG22847.1 Quinolinate phosphoribosyltransferase (decarboxylating) [Prochlorococcus marinus str. SS35]KGG3
MNIITPNIHHLLDTWLNEDLGRGDLSQSAVENYRAHAHWVSKQEGIFCGGEIVKCLFQRLDPSIEITLQKGEGAKLMVGEKIMDLNGPVASLLAGERTALNLAMHLSGVATATKRLVSKLQGTGILLADTRKTTPGLRQLEKYAVRCGGGINHRLGLDDAAMLKENHIAWSHGIKQSIHTLRSNIPWTTKIIVEAETTQEAKEAVSAGADGILLDEMSPNEITNLIPQLRELAKQNSKELIIEASGIDPNKILDFASTGVDIISTSSPITQSTWIDFSMRFNKQEVN